MTHPITNHQDFSSGRQQQAAEIQQWMQEIEDSNADAAQIYSAMFSRPDPLREKSERELETDVLQSLVHSRFTKASLAQIARWNGLPLEQVETIAQQIAEHRLGTDLERLEFESVVSQIQKLEADEKDAGIREWKLQSLARRIKRTPRQLMDAYNKALCRQAPVKPLSVAEFRAANSKEVEWLIPGWIVKGTTVLFHGDGGAGKTLFTYEVMECILQGKPWNGYPVEQGNVLLVQIDEPSLVTSDRIDIRGIRDTDPLYILSDWQVEAIANLESYIAESQPSLVIVDSLTAINRNCIFSENDTEYARPLLQLAALGDKYGCTVLIIHHSNADGKARGTRAIHNSVSEVWGLSVVSETDRMMSVQKTRLGRAPGRYRFRFDDEDFTFHYQGEDRGDYSEDSATQEERVRLWLSDNEHRGIAYAAIELAEAMSLSKDSVRRVLHELWAKGLVKRKRPKGERQYLYYTGEFTKLPTDQVIKPSDQVIRTSDHPESLPRQALSASDQVISKKAKKFTVENEKNRDHFDHLITTSAQPDTPTESQPIIASDQTSDQALTAADQLALIGNKVRVSSQSQQLVEVGDLVLVTGDAVWIRSGSSKLPWKEVPPSRRNDAEIPVNVLGEPLFLALTEGGKVVEVSRDGQKVKVRNQHSGTDAVYRVEHVRVLSKGG